MTDLPISARLGANIRRYRRSRGMTLRRLSELLHDVGLELSVSGLSRLEHGDRPVTVDELVLVADVLDLPPVDLLEEQTIITGGGDLRMSMDVQDLDEAPAEPQPPTPIVDPKVLEVLTSLAIGAELRGLMEMLASTTVTRTQSETLRLLASAFTAGLGEDLAEKVQLIGRAAGVATTRATSRSIGDAVTRRTGT
jgi:transcriptional regulator with XRE-family HTH domain